MPVARSLALVASLSFVVGACATAHPPVIEVAPSDAPVDADADPIAAPRILGAMETTGTIAHVTDGDTIVVRVGDAEQHVRLIGIDTPESKRPDTPVECFAKEAANALSDLLPVGTRVHLEHDVEATDRYGRTLAYVYRASDGLFVNFEMVRTGMAVPLSFRPNTTYTDDYSAAGTAAERHAIGLWSACAGGHEPLGAATLPPRSPLPRSSAPK